MFPASEIIRDEKNGTHATLTHAPAEKRTRTVPIPKSALARAENEWEAKAVPRKDAVRARRMPSRVTMMLDFWSRAAMCALHS